LKYKRVFIDTIGYELAPEVVTSSEIEERLAPLYATLRIQPGQLESMTGIAERRFWEPGFPVSRGAALAAEQALASSSVKSTDIGALVYAGVCREHFEPATACHVAGRLREKDHPLSPRAHIYDLSNACLGMLNGMIDIANRIELGQIRAGMVVSCESAREIVDTMIDRMLHERDMGLFKTAIATMTGGSAAGAIILSDGSFGNARGHRLAGGVSLSAPQWHELCRWGIEPLPGPRLASENAPSYRQFMCTDSVQVLEHGIELGKATWKAFIEELGWSAGVDRSICHQVGMSHRDAILRMLDLAGEHDFVSYDYLGNTGTVALPLAAALAAEREFLEAGQRVGFLGIGSGLNCTMLGVEW
jgi:3-oxoacyl-[acyl-carrier-protein] synthase III